MPPARPEVDVMQFPIRALYVLCLVLAAAGAVRAEEANPLRQSWLQNGGKAVSRRLEARFADTPAVNRLLSGGAGKPTPIRITPAGDSGAIGSLATALGGENDLKESLAQLKALIEAELEKEGKRNDLGAAFTLFAAACGAASVNVEVASEKAQENLLNGFTTLLREEGTLTGVSPADRQRMYDWLVLSGGFVMLAHQAARQANDAGALKNVAVLGDAFLQTVFGVPPNGLTLEAAGLKAKPQPKAVPVASPANSLSGTWRRSASVGQGARVVNGQFRVEPSGYFKTEYRFAPDGTYRYRSEQWFGYTRSGKPDEYWTRSETGAYKLTGERLELTPKSSTSFLVSSDGKKSPGPALSSRLTAYRMQLHYFEGLKELQLVLTPDKETERDGGFGGNAAFPNAYLFSTTLPLEWRFQ
jgi:hypothetical protein